MKYGDKYGTLYGDGWIKEIIDRTAKDIESKAAKAYLNAKDLNRIEHNVKYLADALNLYGYSQSLTHKADWTMRDFPYADELERLLANIQTLLSAYHAQAVPLPATMQKLRWDKLNDVEGNLASMRQMIRKMERSFVYCGTIYSGQGVRL